MIKCIIFDLDGTLVDSEPLCNQAFLDLLPELHLPVSDLVARFRGRKLLEVFRELEHIIGRRLPDGFEAVYRAHVEANFQSSLLPFPGVHDALRSIDMPMCVASSGPQAKIQSALRKSKLDEFFPQLTFSSYDIGLWKPDPGLFLYAASEMGMSPETCLVIEDSAVGIAAAKAAQMKYLQFCHCAPAIGGVDCFNTYPNLPRKIEELSAASFQAS